MLSLSDIHLAVVCPMANESHEGLRFIQAVLESTSNLGQVTCFVVLDRVSKDNTRELLEEFAQVDSRVRIVWAPENRCVVDAYLRGYRAALAAGADWILEIDAGFSHDPRQIPRFFEAMSSGCDCAFGSRFMPGGKIERSSWVRRFVSHGGSLLTNLLIGTSLHDMTSGFEMFTPAALEMVLQKGIQSRAHFFQTEIKVHCRNLKIAEIPITYCSASPSLSQSSLEEAFQQLWRLFKLRLRGKLDEPVAVRRRAPVAP